MEQSRVCPGCKILLPMSAFGKKSGPKARKDGTRSRCKSCDSAASKLYVLNNRDSVKETKRKWEEKNPHKKAEYDKAYREKYPELKAERAKTYRINNQDKLTAYRMNRPEEMKARKRASDRAYGVNNRDKTKLHSRKYRLTNPDKAKAAGQRYRNANPEMGALKAMKRRAIKKHNGVYLILTKELLNLYKSPCFYCGSNGKVEADHVVAIIRGGQHSIGNLVAACRACNGSKGSKTIMEWRKWQQQ